MILVRSRKLTIHNATARELWATYYRVRMVNGNTYIERFDTRGVIEVAPLIMFVYDNDME